MGWQCVARAIIPNKKISLYSRKKTHDHYLDPCPVIFLFFYTFFHLLHQLTTLKYGGRQPLIQRAVNAPGKLVRPSPRGGYSTLLRITLDWRLSIIVSPLGKRRGGGGARNKTVSDGRKWSMYLKRKIYCGAKRINRRNSSYYYIMYYIFYIDYYYRDRGVHPRTYFLIAPVIVPVSRR